MVRRSLRPAIDARSTECARSSTRLARIPVPVGHPRPRRLAVLRRVRCRRGLRQPQSIDGAGSRGLARHGGALARLAARPGRRLRLHDRARQARHLPRAHAGVDAPGCDRRAGWTRCSTPSPTSGVASTCGRRSRPPSRASGSITSPIRTGTRAARWSPTSRSSTALRAQDPAVAARVEALGLRRGRAANRRARPRAHDGPEPGAARGRSCARSEAAPPGEGRRSAGR